MEILSYRGKKYFNDEDFQIFKLRQIFYMYIAVANAYSNWNISIVLQKYKLRRVDFQAKPV